jgi:hypothetical protein
MMAEDTFSTVTPCCVTVCGSSERAWLTRFCTLTWLMSGSLPGLNTAWIATLPDDELVEEKYSRLSTPLICASIGAATWLAMTSAVAPG